MLQWNADEWHKDFLRKTALNLSCHCYVLDVGCGDGEDCKIISPSVNYVVGIDINLSSFRLPKVANLDFIVADACDLPFKDSVFDVVFEKDALHHIRNHKRGLAEMKRVAKKGGQVVAVEANRYNPILYLHMTLLKGHQHFTKKYLENLLAYYFRHITLRSVESHVYPITNKYILRLVHFIEDFVAKVPRVKSFLSYNIAISEKNE